MESKMHNYYRTRNFYVNGEFEFFIVQSDSKIMSHSEANSFAIYYDNDNKNLWLCVRKELIASIVLIHH